MDLGKRWRLVGLPLLCAALGFDFTDADDTPAPAPSWSNPLTLTRPPAPAGPSNWDEWEHPEREPRKVKSQTDGDWGSVTSQTVHADWQESLIWEDPLRKREWKTEQAWHYNMLGPFFVFGNLGANSEESAPQLKVLGKTGVACKMPLIWNAEVTVRSGPSVTCTDPLDPDHTKERSEWLLEFQARWPILAGIGLEYDGTAVPALSPLEKNTVDQDLRFAIPVGGNGKVKLGAKHHWETTTESHSWSDGMQLYLGLELTR